MGENGILSAGNRASAIRNILLLAGLVGVSLFSAFTVGVRYATSDIRSTATANAIKNAEQDERIEGIAKRQIDTNLMLLYLSEAWLADPKLTRDQRAALKKMREVYVGVGDWK